MGILDIAAGMDWTHWVWSVIGDRAHGPHHTFTFPTCHMSGREVEVMLRDRGIRTWGLLHVDNTTMISVRKQDAQRAYSLLQQHGVPVENPPPQPRRSSRKARGGARQGGVFDVFDVFD